jgi:hypothetical protein
MKTESQRSGTRRGSHWLGNGVVKFLLQRLNTTIEELFGSGVFYVVHAKAI